MCVFSEYLLMCNHYPYFDPQSVFESKPKAICTRLENTNDKTSNLCEDPATTLQRTVIVHNVFQHSHSVK